jgi:hypothetical protein
MKKTELSIIVILFVAVSSTKKDLDDPQNYIRGRVVLYNEEDKEIKGANLSDIEIKLTNDNTDTINFLYSTKSDPEGYFIFNVPANNRQPSYYMFSKYVGKDSLILAGTAEAKNDNGFSSPILALKPVFGSQNLFKLTVADSVQGLIGNCPVSFFTSSVVSNNSYTLNPSFTYTTNANGVIRKVNMPPGDYYLNVFKDFGNSLILKAKSVHVMINATGKVEETLTLYRKD